MFQYHAACNIEKLGMGLETQLCMHELYTVGHHDRLLIHALHMQLVLLVLIYRQAMAHAQTAQLTVSVRKKDWLSVHVLRGTKELIKKGKICHAQVKITRYQ